MNRVTSSIAHAAEQTAIMVGDLSRSLLPWNWNFNQVRGWFSAPRFGIRFWPTTHPAAEGTQVNYEVTRALYRNSNEMALGSGFAKPIVDLQVGFMGIPTASTGNPDTDEALNQCISVFWADGLQQMFRDAIRDSKVIMRFSRPDILDPLMTMDEAEHGTIECLPPERVDIERNLVNKNIIERAVVRHRMLFVLDDGNPATGQDPRTEEHDVLEIIDRQSYRFFDQTTSEWLSDMQTPNRWGFVPLLEVHNEWDTALQGGMSDFETVIPFMRAFHDVLTQGLQAHTYHSTPKVVLHFDDVATFIKNNFPEALGEDGQIKPESEISWRGREILLIQREDKVEFLEANSILGDTKVMAEFLIDCICIASQTPEWAFMRVDSGSANSDRNAQTVPFVKKIDRKRRGFQLAVQELCKMYLASRNLIPVRPSISWGAIRVDDQVVEMQAFQQLVMGLEAARGRGEISDATYQNMIRMFLPVMGSNTQELSKPDPASQPAIPQFTGAGNAN